MYRRQGVGSWRKQGRPVFRPGAGAGAGAHVVLVPAGAAGVRALSKDGAWTEARAPLPGVEAAMIFVAPGGAVHLPKLRSREPLEIEWLRFVPGRGRFDRLPAPHPAFAPVRQGCCSGRRPAGWGTRWSCAQMRSSGRA